MPRYILAIDQGTSGTKVIIVDHEGAIVSRAYREITSYYPQPGWVEQDPREIWNTTLSAISEAFLNGRVSAEDVEAIGIANQVGTTIFWNKQTGESAGRAIVWQDCRSQSICSRLAGMDESGIKARAGVLPLPNFSATKIRWLMENDTAISKGMARGELLFGTINTWLIWKLSGGAAHVTDRSNAVATLLFNTRTLGYDDWMLSTLEIPRETLPRVHSSSEICANTDPKVFWGVKIPIAGGAGDQSAAVVGQACFKPGTAKVTYGTGSSLAMNTGPTYPPHIRELGVLVLWAPNNTVNYGLMGWTNVSGAAIRWLQDGLGIIREAGEAEGLATRVADSQGVYFVPIFGGMPAPHLNTRARGTIVGITQDTTRHHIARAALEAMAYQTRDSYEIMQRESQVPIPSLRADGGAQNDFLLQFLADILGIPVERPVTTETSAIGAAYLAGLAVGYWQSVEEVASKWKLDRRFEPGISADRRESRYAGWQKALAHAAEWLKE